MMYLRLLFLMVATSWVLAAPQAAVKPVATVESVTVTGGNTGIDIEIESSLPIAPRSQLTADPDRLILDFPNALPATDLRSRLLNREEVKGFRVGVFARNPPVTRVVIDMNMPLRYRIFPSGKTVMVKLTSDQQQAAARAHVDNVSYQPAPAKPEPRLAIEYKNGRMSIWSNKASLAEVLSEVQKRTGTDIPIPPGAAQEEVVASIAMAPIREALGALLNGSRFNFIMVGADGDPSKLKSVILSPRSGSGISQPAFAAPVPPPVAESESEPEQQPLQPEMQAPPPPEGNVPPQEVPPPQENPPPQ